jgi:small subunit ribosomal protein S1
MKALIPTPIETFVANNKIGDTVVGEVVQKLPFGIILELDEKVRGLLHRSEFSWNPDDNFQSYVKIGDKVETKITSLDAAKNKISLSRRLLLDNPWENVSFERGELVEAKVLEVNADGLVVLAKGVNGIIPINELSKERVDDPAKLFAVDDKVKAIVTTVNPKNWYLRLSIKAYELREEKKAYEKHLVEEDVETTSIGELIVEMLEEENDKE